MSRSLWSVVLVAAAVLTGCGTPSVHAIYSKDKEITEPALVGAWKAADASDKTTYEVKRDGDAYRLAVTVTGDQGAKPERYEFEVHLVQLGSFKFADFAATEP